MSFRVLLFALALGALAARLSAQSIQPSVAVPAESAIDSSAVNLSLKKDLDQRYAALQQRFEKWNAQAAAFNAQYGGRDFKDGSAEAAAGLAEQSRLSKSLKSYEHDAGLFKAEVAKLRLKKIDAPPVVAAPAAKKVAEIIDAMNALARRLGWNAEEQARLDQALKKLDYEGATNVTVGDIQHTWRDVVSRGPESAIAREAAAGRGPGFAGAGKQTEFNDCAVFALANAAGLPYGVAAARAADLIRQGEWRDGTERANPQQIIEQQGLMGGEVVMLAEAFGQAEIVSGKDFAATLKEGRTVLLNVVPSGGRGAHEVVLTKTFRHDGATWYEMMESTRGPQRRLYLSAAELNIIQQENGVALRPEAGTTPKLLRKSGSQ